MSLQLIAENFVFLEAPRWREDRLWFSDMYDGNVYTSDIEGNTKLIVSVPNQPSGLGWLPGGGLLIVSMLDRKVLLYDNHKLVEYADISDLATGPLNDMVVDKFGNAYIGNMGFDPSLSESPKDAEIIHVKKGGESSVVAKGMKFPNGCAISPDGSCLIVAESLGSKMTAFNIHKSGELRNRQVWADLEFMPDGCCMDIEGALWVASPLENRVVRVTKGGKMTGSIETESMAIACTLGGPSLNHLFILTSTSLDIQTLKTTRPARIYMTEVKVPGSGSP